MIKLSCKSYEIKQTKKSNLKFWSLIWLNSKCHKNIEKKTIQYNLRLMLQQAWCWNEEHLIHMYVNMKTLHKTWQLVSRNRYNLVHKIQKVFVVWLTPSTSSVLMWEGPGCTGLSMTIGLSRADETVRGGWLAIELLLGSSPEGGASTHIHKNEGWTDYTALGLIFDTFKALL